MTSTLPLRTLVSAVTLAAAALLSACGGDSDRTRASPPAVAVVRLGDPGTPSGAYAIAGPQSVAQGAVRFEVTNDGKTERGAELIAVTDSHTLGQAFAALIKARDGAPTPGWVRWAGGIGVLRAGQRGSFTVELPPGRYYAIDRSFRGKPAALAKVASRAELSIRRQNKPAQLPGAAPTIIATEYRFRARGLIAGEHVVRLENAGSEPHNFVISPLRDSKTLADVKTYVQDDSGPPPVDFARETISGVLAPGTRENLPLDLAPGRYALLCFASDRAGGPPHVAKGMLSEVTVR